MRHSYRLEMNRDGTFQLSRVTERDPEQGWMETGTKTFATADEARDYLPKDKGLVRSWPPAYGMSNVIEYWDEPR
jgi:hypothetical protein